MAARCRTRRLQRSPSGGGGLCGRGDGGDLEHLAQVGPADEHDHPAAGWVYEQLTGWARSRQWSVPHNRHRPVGRQRDGGNRTGELVRHVRRRPVEGDLARARTGRESQPLGDRERRAGRPQVVADDRVGAEIGDVQRPSGGRERDAVRVRGRLPFRIRPGSRRAGDGERHAGNTGRVEGQERNRTVVVGTGSHRPNGTLTAVRLRFSAITMPSSALAAVAVPLLAVLLLTRTTSST